MSHTLASPLPQWHRIEPPSAVRELRSNETRGLSTDEAAARLRQYGANELLDQGSRHPWRILWEQFTSTMVLILLGATVLSSLLGQTKEALAIGAIVCLFGLLGFIQEHRAERAMAALKKLSAPLVRVFRDGQVSEVSARELVPGDVISVEAGNLVPADGRVLTSAGLRLQEAPLTGESEPVDKDARVLPEPDLAVSERRNMVYLGTTVVYGRGRVLVVATGMQTELGSIASLLQRPNNDLTPLQRRLDGVGKVLAVVGVVIAAAVFVLGMLRGEDARHLLLTAVSIAVAVVPEGLPAVVTITLALGAQRMLRRHALIRRLPAVETLGSVTIICSDKTGTLTQNKMTATVAYAGGRHFTLSRSTACESSSHLTALLGGGALCNDASLRTLNDGQLDTLGDPTEGALLLAAERHGLSRDRAQEALPRVAELAFDADRKRMTTFHRWTGAVDDTATALRAMVCPSNRAEPYLALTKGAPDRLLRRCIADEQKPLTDGDRLRITGVINELAVQGVRVLGVAARMLDTLPSSTAADVIDRVERDLVFLGLIGIVDPPRAEAAEAVQRCRAAGIRPVMITGDHPLTALQIARQLGIANTAAVLTGPELQRLSRDEIDGLVEQISVFARVSPEHKLTIVEALQRKGHVVAMTGDGINDAPALRKADIGVAMGITGTDVSKEAADMVLRDDNFATIVAAVEEGRGIYDNLRKFIQFSVAGNLGKVLVMLLAPFLGGPLPLLPLQLLWLNLLTDGLLGLGLGLEPVERNAMRRPPHSPSEGMFAHGAGRQIVWVGTLIGALGLGSGYWQWTTGHDSWQTMLFTTLAFAQVAQVLAVRSSRESLRSLGILSNRPLAALATLVVALQLAVVYLPVLQAYFQTVPLTFVELGTSALLASLVLIAMETEKQIRARRMP